MLIYLIMISFFFIVGMISFCFKRKHLLLMLLVLEFIVLFIYLLIYFYLMIFNYEYYFCMFYLTMSVCEGTLGLSILISMIRNYGNDYMYLFNVLW